VGCTCNVVLFSSQVTEWRHWHWCKL